jgi:hypothetical protein
MGWVSNDLNSLNLHAVKCVESSSRDPIHGNLVSVPEHETLTLGHTL